MRSEVNNLISKGPLPSSTEVIQQITEWQETLEKVEAPLSDEEAEAVTALFPPKDDDCFGLAWTLIHLVETSPHWPVHKCLQDTGNPWIARLRERCSRKGIENSAI